MCQPFLLGLISFSCFLFSSVCALGHDLWLIPPQSSKIGEAQTILAHSGMEFPKSEHAANPAKFKLRQLISSLSKEEHVESAGTEGNAGLLRFTPRQKGIYLVGVQTEPKIITLEPTEFNQYLVSDGLPHIFELRHREKSLDQPGRERYSKSPKVLLQVGQSHEGSPCKPMGLTLEIVPERNPFMVKQGETLPIQVLFHNCPLANANLGWTYEGAGPMGVGTVRTDQHGKALIPISKSGLMTIRLTHMTRPKTTEYEWESFWTTLTWRIPQ